MAAIRAGQRRAYAEIGPYIAQLKAEGYSFAGIAKRLNEEGRTTRYGKRWTHTQVSRVLEVVEQNLELSEPASRPLARQQA
nr:recombinase family protein [Deinobacterium chartae]